MPMAASSVFRTGEEGNDDDEGDDAVVELIFFFGRLGLPVARPLVGLPAFMASLVF